MSALRVASITWDTGFFDYCASYTMSQNFCGGPYKRILGDVYVAGEYGRELWVNREMIEAGMAWHYVHYDRRQILADAEGNARASRRGLWFDAKPEPPWDFRARERDARAASRGQERRKR